MTRIPRKSDGRRIFTDAFKRTQIDRVRRGEVTVAELSRKLGIARSLLQRWKRSMPRAAGSAPEASARHSPLTRLGAEKYILELQLLVGQQTVEIAFLRAELDARDGRGRPSRGLDRS